MLSISVAFILGFFCGRFVCKRHRHHHHRNSPTVIGFYIGGEKVDHLNLKVNMQVPVSIVAEDEFGNATGAFDAAPAFSVVDPTLGSVVAASDGLSAVFTPSGKLGQSQLQVLGVADGKTISGDLDLVLIPGDAVKIVIQAGTPVDAPAPAPAPVAPSA